MKGVWLLCLALALFLREPETGEQNLPIDGGRTEQKSGKKERTLSESSQICFFFARFSTINEPSEEGQERAGCLLELQADREEESGSFREIFDDGDVEEFTFLADPEFFRQLQQLVWKYDLEQYHGWWAVTDGLPDFFGEEFRIDYRSGEAIYASDNQENILPGEAVAEITALFRSYEFCNDSNTEK